MKRLFLAAAPVAALLAPAPAAACFMHPVPLAMLHSGLPDPLPTGAIVAEVEAGPDANDNMLYDGMRVRVLRMLQGETAPELILRSNWVTDCQIVLDEDRRGLIVAFPDGHRDGIPVAWPVFAESELGYRLPNGYQLPPLSELQYAPRRRAAAGR